MDISPIAYYRGPFGSKFGIPRQSSVIEDIGGCIVFEPAFRSRDAIKGLEGFDWLWLIWGFSANQTDDKTFHATVRPPRLGGNRTVGVFASRSPFRPNPLGLSSVRLASIELDAPSGPLLHVLGADLMDGTPIYDIKPYLSFCDSHPDAKQGFISENDWEELEVVLPAEAASLFSPNEMEILRRSLALDPRPRVQHDQAKVYGFPFSGHEVRFTVSGRTLTVVGID